MDFTPYVRELDAELAQLQAARRMLLNLREPLIPEVAAPRRKTAAIKPVVTRALPEPIVEEPTLTTVPPKQRREYHPRGRARVEAKAIGGSIPDRPVYVRAATPVPNVEVPVALDAAALEAAVRRNLLGHVA